MDNKEINKRLEKIESNKKESDLLAAEHAEKVIQKELDNIGDRLEIIVDLIRKAPDKHGNHLATTTNEIINMLSHTNTKATSLIYQVVSVSKKEE